MPKMLTVTVSAVGKGRVVFVHTPQNKTILIDTGPDAHIVRTLGTLLPPWRRQIDAVILTNSSPKYIGGLREVATRYKISTLVRFGAIVNKNMKISLIHIAQKITGKSKDKIFPYGTQFNLGNKIIITINAPETIILSYGTTIFEISSSTAMKTYALNKDKLIEK